MALHQENPRLIVEPVSHFDRNGLGENRYSHSGASTVTNLVIQIDKYGDRANSLLQDMRAVTSLRRFADSRFGGPKSEILSVKWLDSLTGQLFRAYAMHSKDDPSVAVAIGINMPIAGQDLEVGIAMTTSGRWNFLAILDGEAEARFRYPISEVSLESSIKEAVRRAS